MTEAVEDDVIENAETRILKALRSGDVLTVDQIAERFGVLPWSVKVLISNIRKHRLAPNESIPNARTGRGASAEYRLITLPTQDHAKAS